MADSIVEILNTSITSTELPTSSSSHTILTTDANTSYVIKDVQANAYVTGLTAKINNFAVGDWSQTRTGSEVVDVNSTISVSCENFPVEVQQIRASAFDVQSFTGFDETYGIVNNELAVSNIATMPPVVNPNTGDNTAYVNTMFSVNNITYQISLQNNSTRILYKWETPNSRTNLGTTNYGLLCLAEDQDAIFYRSSASLRKLTLSTGAVTTINPSVWSLPDATSTYERSAYCNGWLFELPSNSAQTYVYAFNSATGIYIKFEGLRDMGGYGVGTSLFVSYNESTDEFYVYRTEDGTSSDLSQDILPLTKTQMDANTSNTTNSTLTTQSVIGGYQIYFPRDGRYFSEFLVGSPKYGNIFYAQHRTANYAVFECNYGSKTAKKITDRKQSNINCGSYLSVFTPNLTQISELGFPSNPNEIELRITGVKTTA